MIAEIQEADRAAAAARAAAVVVAVHATEGERDEIDARVRRGPGAP